MIVEPIDIPLEVVEVARLAAELMRLHGITSNTYGSETLWDAAAMLRRTAIALTPPALNSTSKEIK